MNILTSLPFLLVAAQLSALIATGAEIPLPITENQTLATITSPHSSTPHLTHSIRAIRYPSFDVFGYYVDVFLECWPSAAIVDFSAEQASFPPSAQIGPPPIGTTELARSSHRIQSFQEQRNGSGPDSDWSYRDPSSFGPVSPFLDSVRPLTEFLVGFRFAADDGLHYGWIHFRRSTADFRSVFQVAASEWNPVPNAPIRAGLPPDIQLSVEATPAGLRLSWPSVLTNHVIEATESLDGNGAWQAVIPAQGNEMHLPVPTSTRFYRLRRP